jgi:hemerythrin-like domain-containing protein
MDTEPANIDLRPYATLAREHRLIERALELLRRFCDDVVRTRTLDPAVARELLRFLREFADRTHHLKEERILFPAIESKGLFPGCGLLSEHELGRTRVRNMAAAVQRASAGDAETRKVFVQQARSYINLLRAHIAKEDDCLASVCARTFDSQDGERLSHEFDELERLEMGERAFERFATLVEALEAQVGAGTSSGQP